MSSLGCWPALRSRCANGSIPDVIELENPSVAWGLENKDFKPWKTGAGNMVLMPGKFNPVTDEKVISISWTSKGIGSRICRKAGCISSALA